MTSLEKKKNQNCVLCQKSISDSGLICDDCQANHPEIICNGGCSDSCEERFKCFECQRVKCVSVFHGLTCLCKNCAYFTCLQCKCKVLIVDTTTNICWTCQVPKWVLSFEKKDFVKTPSSNIRCLKTRVSQAFGSLSSQTGRKSSRLMGNECSCPKCKSLKDESIYQKLEE